MTYYIIKTHYIPTEKCLAIRPEAVEFDWFEGKAGFTMNTERALGDLSKNQLWDAPYALENAYTRLCDAKRSLKSHKNSNSWEMKNGIWNVDSEIITVEA